MQATQIIKKPLITEKSTWQAESNNRYSFVVDIAATKQQIRDAIVELYKVRVEDVCTQVRKGKQFRNKFGFGKKSDWKRAMVQIHPEDKIELF